jgi:hypothetical protein
MAPAVFIYFGLETSRRTWRGAFLGNIATGAWHSSAAAVAFMPALPRSPRMVLADLAAILASLALHRPTGRLNIDVILTFKTLQIS